MIMLRQNDQVRGCHKSHARTTSSLQRRAVNSTVSTWRGRFANRKYSRSTISKADAPS